MGNSSSWIFLENLRSWWYFNNAAWISPKSQSRHSLTILIWPSLAAQHMALLKPVAPHSLHGLMISTWTSLVASLITSSKFVAPRFFTQLDDLNMTLAVCTKHGTSKTGCPYSSHRLTISIWPSKAASSHNLVKVCRSPFLTQLDILRDTPLGRSPHNLVEVFRPYSSKSTSRAVAIVSNALKHHKNQPSPLIWTDSFSLYYRYNFVFGFFLKWTELSISREFPF